MRQSERIGRSITENSIRAGVSLSLPEPEVPKRKIEVVPSMAFEKFNEGYTPMEVVLETDADPVKIRDWYRAWLDMRSDWAKVKGRELDGEARETLVELMELLGADSVKFQGKKPSGLVAAMSYILAKMEGLPVSQTRVAEQYGVSDMLVYQNRKLLEQAIKDKGLKLTARHFVVVPERGQKET